LLYFPLAFVINYLFGVIVGSSAFMLKDKLNYDGVVQSYVATVSVLSGSIIPLDKLDSVKFLQFLPSAWLLHHPMQVYLGKYSTFENISFLILGLVWIACLYLVASFVFKKGLKHHEANGL
jgi:ABC-type uncharacterized transport system permease subunit